MGKGLTHLQVPWLPPNTIDLAGDCFSAPAWGKRAGGLSRRGSDSRSGDREGRVQTRAGSLLAFLLGQTSRWDTGGSSVFKKELQNRAYPQPRSPLGIGSFHLLTFTD